MNEDSGGIGSFDTTDGGVTIEVRSPDGPVMKIRLNADVAPEDACTAAREAAANLAIARIKRAGHKRAPTGGELFWSWALPQR